MANSSSESVQLDASTNIYQDAQEQPCLQLAATQRPSLSNKSWHLGRAPAIKEERPKSILTVSVHWAESKSHYFW